MGYLLWIFVFSTIININLSVRIDYNSGTIIRHTGQTLNAGYTKLKIILKIPNVKNITLVRYKQPCDLRLSLIADLNYYNITNPIYANEMHKFENMCRRNSKLRRSSLTIRRTYEEHIKTIQQTISDLVPHTKRNRRSFSSTVRHVFGIADYNRQKSLQNQVQQLSIVSFEQQGQLVGMNFAIEHIEERLQKLYKSASIIINTTNTLGRQLDVVTQKLNVQQILEKYEGYLLADAIQSGIIQNQCIARYSRIIEERLHSFSTLARGYLPAELVTPNELNDILVKVETSLLKQHPLMNIIHRSVYEYYTKNNIVSYTDGSDTFVKIPVTINLHEQDFSLFTLETFMMPVLKLDTQAMVIYHDEMIAINENANTYFTLNNEDLKNCYGHRHIVCGNLFTQHFIQNSDNCELSLYLNQVDKIRDSCEIGLTDVEKVETKFHYITDNKILIVNPQRRKIFEMCKKNMMQKYVSNEFIFEVTLECFCYLITEDAISPIFAHEKCTNNTAVTVHNPSENIIYISLLLNQSMIELSDYNISSIMPLLELPQIQNKFHFDDNTLDLKRIIYERSNEYKNMILNRLDGHSNELQSFNIVKPLIYGVPILILLIMIIAMCLVIKTNSLRKLISVAGLIKTTEAAPIMQRSQDILSITLDSVVIILAILALCYCLLKYFKLFKKFKKYITLPFSSCIIMKETQKVEIIFYIENVQDCCMIYIDSLMYTAPSEIKLIQNDQQISITLHSGCMASYLTFSNELKIKLNNNNNKTYRLPNALHIPFYLKDKVAKIINEEYSAKLLIGSGGIYFSQDLKQHSNTSSE